MNRTLKCIAVVLGSGAVVHAHAGPPSIGLITQAPACSASVRTDNTVLNPGYIACLGSFEGNIDKQLSDIWSAMSTAVGGWSSVARSYVSDESFAAAMNPFSQNEGASEDGTINFDAPQTGLFALGLKQGNGFSLYLFDGSRVTGGISSLAYDTTGVKAKSDSVYSLSHAGYFGAVTPVPEPSAYAMMLAGLAVVGFALKRRRG